MNGSPGATRADRNGTPGATRADRNGMLGAARADRPASGNRHRGRRLLHVPQRYRRRATGSDGTTGPLELILRGVLSPFVSRQRACRVRDTPCAASLVVGAGHDRAAGGIRGRLTRRGPPAQRSAQRHVLLGPLQQGVEVTLVPWHQRRGAGADPARPLLAGHNGRCTQVGARRGVPFPSGDTPVPGPSTTNASPSQRATTSVERVAIRSASATVTRTASPARRPASSFTLRRPSTSTEQAVHRLALAAGVLQHRLPREVEAAPVARAGELVDHRVLVRRQQGLVDAVLRRQQAAPNQRRDAGCGQQQRGHLDHRGQVGELAPAARRHRTQGPTAERQAAQHRDGEPHGPTQREAGDGDQEPDLGQRPTVAGRTTRQAAAAAASSSSTATSGSTQARGRSAGSSLTPAESGPTGSTLRPPHPDADASAQMVI